MSLSVIITQLKEEFTKYPGSGPSILQKFEFLAGTSSSSKIQKIITSLLYIQSKGVLMWYPNEEIFKFLGGFNVGETNTELKKTIFPEAKPQDKPRVTPRIVEPTIPTDINDDLLAHYHLLINAGMTPYYAKLLVKREAPNKMTFITNALKMLKSNMEQFSAFQGSQFFTEDRINKTCKLRDHGFSDFDSYQASDYLTNELIDIAIEQNTLHGMSHDAAITYVRNL
jgi:hypothetical protein